MQEQGQSSDYHSPESRPSPGPRPSFRVERGPSGDLRYSVSSPPFTPEQEERIREIVFAMTHLALEDYHVRQGKPAISALADDFWREPDGSIPPKPLSEDSVHQVLTQDIPAN